MAARRPRLSKTQLFAMVGYHPHPLQLEIHLSRARRRVVATGCRFGKTTLGSYDCLAAVLEPCERSRGWVVGPTVDTPDRILQQVRAILEQYFPDRVRSYDPRTRTLVVTNLGGGRSELRAKSTDSSAALLGESLTYLVCDEAASVREGDWQVCMQRLVDQRGWSLALSVPKGAGWFCDAFRMGQRNRDPESRSWTAPTSANPLIAAEAIEAERARMSADEFRSQYGGEFIGVPPEPCISCGGAKEGRPSVVIIGVDTDERRNCPLCGDPIDRTGTSMVTLYPTGRGFVKIIEGIELRERPQAAPPIPGSSPESLPSSPN